MEYNKLKSILIKNEDAMGNKGYYTNNFDKFFVINNGTLDKTYLMQKLSRFLSDNSVFIDKLNEKTLIKLYNMFMEYFETCYAVYMDMQLKKYSLPSLIKFCKYSIYKVNTEDGDRIATINEVNNGVIGLKEDVIEVIPESVMELLYCILWTFDGSLYNYKNMHLQYIKNDGNDDLFTYNLILNAGKILRKTIDFIKNKEVFNDTINKLKEQSKKKNLIKYPSFAVDEIVESMTAKQIIFVCLNKMNGNLTNEQKKAKLLADKAINKKYTLSPIEISFMRECYDSYKAGNVGETTSEQSHRIEVCKKLQHGVDIKVFNGNEFVFKIVNTVLSKGFCTDKQLKILEEYEDILDKELSKRSAIKKEKEISESKNSNSGDSLLDISNALGSGVLISK